MRRRIWKVRELVGLCLVFWLLVGYIASRLA